MLQTIHLPRQTIILLGILVVLLIVFSITSLFTKKSEVLQAPTGNSQFVAPSSANVNIPISGAPNQPVNNFYIGSKFTYPSGDTVVVENDDYQIAFVLKDMQFILTMYPAAPENTQSIVEQKFIDTLKIDQQTACTLKVEVHNYIHSSLSLAPKVSRLSFCN